MTYCEAFYHVLE